MAVVDASVVIKWFANEQNSEEASLLKEAYAKGLEDLSAPCILPFEVLNGLKYTYRAIQGSFANCNISVDLDLFNGGIIEYI